MGIISDLRTSAKNKLEAVRVANTGLIDHVNIARPASANGVPMVYVGDTRVRIQHDMGLRMWDGEQDIVLVDTVSDNQETMTRLATLADIVVDAFTADPHALGANTVSEPTVVGWIPLTFGSTEYEAVVITVGKFTYQEGR